MKLKLFLFSFLLLVGSIHLDASPMFRKTKKVVKEKTVEKLHPQNQKAIEFLFEAEGQDFYKFKSFADLPQIRQTQALQFLSETGQVLDNETMLACLENLAELHSKKNDAEFYRQIGIMRDMANGINYTDAFYHVCSAVSFTLGENINDYDPLIAQNSISHFKRLDKSFFLKTLSERFPSMGMQLPKDLEKSLIGQKVKLNASLIALQGLGVELPMSESLKRFSSGLGVTS